MINWRPVRTGKLQESLLDCVSEGFTVSSSPFSINSLVFILRLSSTAVSIGFLFGISHPGHNCFMQQIDTTQHISFLFTVGRRCIAYSDAHVHPPLHPFNSLPHPIFVFLPWSSPAKQTHYTQSNKKGTNHGRARIH